MPMTAFYKKRMPTVAGRLILYIVLFSSCITLMTTGLQLYLDYKTDIGQLNSEIEHIELSYLDSIRTSLWAFDEEQLALQLSGMLRLRNMQYVSISNNGELLAEAGESKDNNVISRNYDLHYLHNGEDVPLGTLRAVIDLDSVYDRLWDKVWIILASNGAKTFTVAIFTFIFFQSIVTRHLQRIAAFLRKFTPDATHRPLVLDRKQRSKRKGDELDEVVTTLNDVCSGLAISHEALRESKDQVRLLLDSAGEGIYGVDLEGNCTFVNPACLKMLGYDDPADLLGQNMHDRIHHSYRDGSRYPLEESLVYKAFRMGESVHVDDEVLWRADGTSFSVEYGSFPVHRDGTAVGAVVTFTDITERKRIENEIRDLNESLERRVEERTEELRASESRLRAILDNTPAEIHLKDAEGRFLQINRQLEKSLGMTNESAWGKTAYDIMPEAAARDIEAHDKAVMESGEAISREVELERDGETFTYLSLRFPIPGPNGGIAGVGGVGTDITERVRVEKALRDAQGELVRSERLSTLGQLTATVSHELRNPLGVVRASTFVLRKSIDPNDARAQRTLERVERSVLRCDRIIDELLDFTRMKRIELQSTAVDAWLDEFLDEQELLPGVTLQRDLGLSGMELSFDRDRFRRAVINVFDNACQAMVGEGDENAEPGAHVITVRSGRSNGRVEIVFEDNGAGIEPEVYEKIFEPLFSTKGFGVGLGLPVVKQIMEQHDGGIEIESEMGRGTRVTLWLDPLIQSRGVAA